MRRTRLNRIGAVARRYAKARQAFLAVRFHSPSAEKVYMPGNSLPARQVACEAPKHAEDCPGTVIIVQRQDGTGFATTGHVHHVVARSRAPGRREDHSNMKLISQSCHLRYDLDKDGSMWRAEGGS